MMNRRTVERRLLLIIKTKGLAKLVPVNEDADLLARDTAKRCKSVVSFLFTFVKGQQSAMAVGDTLTDDYDEDGGANDEEELPSEPEENAITLAHFCDAGFLYVKEGTKNWILFLARSLNSTIHLREVS